MTIGLEVPLLAQNLMVMLKNTESFNKYLLHLCPRLCV